MKVETRNKLAKFFQQFGTRRYRRGEVIIRPNEKRDEIYFIDDGFAKIYSVNSSGIESGAYFFKSLFYLTLIEKLTGIKNKYYFEAITPATVCVAPEGEVMRFLRENPEIKEEIDMDIMRGFSDLLEQSTSILSANAKSRVAWIILSVNDRLDRENLTRDEIAFEYTHQLIASLTGLTRETVTLQLLSLKKKKIIENKHKNILILDKKALEKIASGIEWTIPDNSLESCR